MHCVYLDSIDRISAADWNTVVNTDYPFLRHEFLYAMQASQSACSKTGWHPQHLVVYEGSLPVAVMPLYLKTHSYGEYVFDWSWASAYEHHGLDYYPKLLSAIPYTPATGARLSCSGRVDKDRLYPFIVQALQEQAAQLQASSIHILLPDDRETASWNEQGLQTRATVQYHWFNHHYRDFDDFLETFASRKRKNLKKERRRIKEQGISIRAHTGSEITRELWDTFYHFYQLTYVKRSGHGGYLRREFFELISATMADQTMLVTAWHQDNCVAGALYFFSSTTLYGRYWGCTHAFDMLHFELCYYQGIEFCLNKGLKKFDAGAQGEHKIQRGFTPTTTWSNHWIKDARFSSAIDDYIRREMENNSAYILAAKNYLPFKK